MRKILGSLALLGALCLPAAAAETVLCRVSGYPAPTACSTQPALLGTSLPVAPGTATAGVATFADREDHRHQLQPKSYTLLTSGSGTYTVPANVTICDVSATGGGGGGGSGRRGTTAAGGGGGGPGGFTVKNSIPVTVLGASVAYTVGAAGVGGPATAVDNTNGTAGTAGGSSTFGVYVRAGGGTGGNGGSTTTSSGGSAGTVDENTAVPCDWLGGEPHLLALQGACSLGANVTSNGTGALRAAGSGDAVLGYAIAEGDTDVSVQVFIQG